jgi:hypothetical protein
MAAQSTPRETQETCWLRNSIRQPDMEFSRRQSGYPPASKRGTCSKPGPFTVGKHTCLKIVPPEIERSDSEERKFSLCRLLRRARDSTTIDRPAFPVISDTAKLIHNGARDTAEMTKHLCLFSLPITRACLPRSASRSMIALLTHWSCATSIKGFALEIRA